MNTAIPSVQREMYFVYAACWANVCSVFFIELSFSDLAAAYSGWESPNDDTNTLKVTPLQAKYHI